MRKRKLSFSYRKVTARKAKEIRQARSPHLRAHMTKMVTWSMQTNSSSGFESQTFRGEKKEYQTWWAAFSSCVDETNLSGQFKMLWLDSCLAGEAGEMVKGPGCLDHAYEAGKARLNQKYGGHRRQVQAHIDELSKMRPINADDPRELERFADIVERPVVS